mmetsp:Transcript_29848/g.58557  ORF Transcript_29848/g.58557 Transcript_29848/m.58557 type:complete len:371 (+) Transcript_29848:52-1164(+)
MRLSFLCLFAAACFAVLCKIAAHPTGCRVSGCDCPATQEDCALAGQSTRDVCFCEHLVGHHRNRSARVTGSSGSSASASSSFAVVQPASVEPVDSQPDHPLPLSADQPSNDEPAGAAASDVGTAPLPDDSDIIDVDDTSRDAEPSTPPTAAAAASSTGAVSGRRRRQREDPPSDDSDDEDFLPALSRSRSTSNRKKAKQGRKVKSSDGHCVHERIMNCPRCGLNFALEVRGSGNRETATIMATFPPGLYESGNGSGSSSSGTYCFVQVLLKLPGIIQLSGYFITLLPIVELFVLITNVWLAVSHSLVLHSSCLSNSVCFSVFLCLRARSVCSSFFGYFEEKQLEAMVMALERLLLLESDWQHLQQRQLLG